MCVKYNMRKKFYVIFSVITHKHTHMRADTDSIVVIIIYGYIYFIYIQDIVHGGVVNNEFNVTHETTVVKLLLLRLIFFF